MSNSRPKPLDSETKLGNHGFSEGGTTDRCGDDDVVRLSDQIETIAAIIAKHSESRRLLTLWAEVKNLAGDAKKLESKADKWDRHVEEYSDANYLVKNQESFRRMYLGEFVPKTVFSFIFAKNNVAARLYAEKNRMMQRDWMHFHDTKSLCGAGSECQVLFIDGYKESPRWGEMMRAAEVSRLKIIII